MYLKSQHACTKVVSADCPAYFFNLISPIYGHLVLQNIVPIQTHCIYFAISVRNTRYKDHFITGIRVQSLGFRSTACFVPENIFTNH